MSLRNDSYERLLNRRHTVGFMFEWLCRLATLAALSFLLVLIGSILVTAFSPGRGKGLAPVTPQTKAPFTESAPEFVFNVSNVSGGAFELKDRPGHRVTAFTSSDLRNGVVQFNHDGRRAAPAYDLKVSTASDSGTDSVAYTKVGPGNFPDDPRVPVVGPPRSPKPWGWLTWKFLTSGNSYEPTEAGIMVGLWGSIWLIFLTACMAVPVGVGAAVYLEEYAKPTILTRFIQLNISNLAGVPSIVYGILGFTVFSRMFGIFDKQATYVSLKLPGMSSIDITLPLGPVLLSGACTLALLSLPVVIITSQEALRAIPASLRHAAYALGATKWQTMWHQVLPAALPGILTGVILSLSRAIGEAAPLAVIGVAAQLSYAPGRITGLGDVLQHPDKLIRAPFDRFTALPIQVYSWVNEAAPNFEHVAAAGILVLLATLLSMNGIAIFVRQRYQRKIQ
ncbi:phosphate ABC transporter permease PstA [Schlesneria sp. DSM 10557]|uniref:phosphate ABC transporter permease PstA n=1 Tax=Schlesneria sp. DSM 10557 TaxID=3044399 RepID=UPI00359FCFD0